MNLLRKGPVPFAPQLEVDLITLDSCDVPGIAQIPERIAYGQRFVQVDAVLEPELRQRSSSRLGADWGQNRPKMPMRMRGLEPPRAEAHTDLNRARLPIPPHPRGVTV
jgi:hypothetical protein